MVVLEVEVQHLWKHCLVEEEGETILVCWFGGLHLVED
jgi:hypothetical protein